MLTAAFVRQQLHDLAGQAAHLADLVDEADLAPLVLARHALAVAAVEEQLEAIEAELHEAGGDVPPV